MAFEDFLQRAGDVAGGFFSGTSGAEQARRRQAQELLGGIRTAETPTQRDALLEQLSTVAPQTATRQIQNISLVNKARNEEEAARQKNFYDTVMEVDALLAAGFEDEAVNIVQQREDILKRNNLNTDITSDFLSTLRNQGSAAAREELKAAIVMGQVGGHIPRPDGAKFQQMSQDGTKAIFLGPPDASGRPAVTAVPIPGIEPPPDEVTREIQKETRRRVGDEVKLIGEAASTIESSLNRVTSLAEEVRKGNRSAVPPLITAGVKLGDPTSAVLEGEIRTAVASPNPRAALIELLSGKNVDTGVIDAVLASVDPLNPENINVDNFLSAMNAQVAANVPILQERFREQRQIAEDNLTERGINSIFGRDLSNRIEGLSGLIQTGGNGGGGVPDGTIIVNPDTGERRQMVNGQWQRIP